MGYTGRYACQVGHIVNRKLSNSYEPCHDKNKIVRVRPAWIQTSLQSMLFAISFPTWSRVGKRTGWILIFIHAGRKPIMLVLSWLASYVPITIPFIELIDLSNYICYISNTVIQAQLQMNFKKIIFLSLFYSQ
jgi:hypothetical protein